MVWSAHKKSRKKRSSAASAPAAWRKKITIITGCFRANLFLYYFLVPHFWSVGSNQPQNIPNNLLVHVASMFWNFLERQTMKNVPGKKVRAPWPPSLAPRCSTHRRAFGAPWHPPVVWRLTDMTGTGTGTVCKENWNWNKYGVYVIRNKDGKYQSMFQSTNLVVVFLAA